MSHTCHAPGCNRLIPPRMFACTGHWFALPNKMRDAIWREYREGQEIDKRPSVRYLAAQQLACAHLVFRPNDEKAVIKALPYISGVLECAKKAIADGLGDPLEGLIPKEWPTMPVVKAQGKAKTL